MAKAMKLLWPLDGIGHKQGVYITQYFGQQLLDYSQFGLKGHNGIDIQAPKGTPIKAVHDGDVIFEYPQNPGYGNEARLYFYQDGVMWDCVFAHLDRFEGQNRHVKEGEVIGYVDSTGFSTGHHLHLGIRQKKDNQILNYNNGYLGYIDPMPYMKIRVPRWIGYKQSKQKDFYLPLPDLETEKAIKEGTLKLTEVVEKMADRLENLQHTFVPRNEFDQLSIIVKGIANDGGLVKKTSELESAYDKMKGAYFLLILIITIASFLFNYFITKRV